MHEQLELENLELEHQANKKTKTEKKLSSNTKHAKKALLGVRATVVKPVELLLHFIEILVLQICYPFLQPWTFGYLILY